MSKPQPQLNLSLVSRLTDSKCLATSMESKKSSNVLSDQTSVVKEPPGQHFDGKSIDGEHTKNWKCEIANRHVIDLKNIFQLRPYHPQPQTFK